MLSSMESPWRYPIAGFVGAFGGAVIGTILATMLAIVLMGDPIDTFDFSNPWFLRYPVEWIAPAKERLIWFVTGLPVMLMTGVAIAGVHRGALTPYDNAHFQSRAEMRRNRMIAGLDQNGFVFGKLSKPARVGKFVSATPDQFPHAMMVAPTGRGKGVGFVLPNLLHFDGSAVVLDVKGENFEKTAIHRQKYHRNRIWYFSPFDYVDAEDDSGSVLTRTHRFNPLARIAAMPSAEQQYTVINAMADLFLVVESVNAQSFFQAGRSLFVAACLYAIETGNPTIGEALRIISGGGNKKEAYKRIAQATQNPTAAEVFLARSDEESKILDSYVSVIRGAGLELWLDPAVDRATSGNDFDFGTFRTEAQSLYIVVQPEHLKTLAPLIRLLFADAIASLQRSHPGPDEPHKVMFLMDEFDQLGRQPIVLQTLKTIRSYGGRFFLISQSIPGLESIYCETDRRALQAAAGVQIYMTPQDDRTADVLSRALGKRTVVGKSRSHSSVRGLTDSENISRRAEERPLLSPAKLLRYPLDKVLILAEGQYPIEAQHIAYYKDRHFGPIDRARHGHPLPYPAPLPAPTQTVQRITEDAQSHASDVPTALLLPDGEVNDIVGSLTNDLRAMDDHAKQSHGRVVRRSPKRRGQASQSHVPNEGTKNRRPPKRKI